MLDNALEALKKYDWGTETAPLAAIEDAVCAAHGKEDVRKDVEARLLAALSGELSRDAKDYVCRKLMVIGSSAAAAVLGKLLADPNQSHMARFALEQIPGAETAQVLRDALAKTTGNVKIGIISSIGGRRDADAVTALAALLNDADAAVARAAVLAVGAIGTAPAAKVLQSTQVAKTETQNAVIDAQLSCAEALLAANKTADAKAIYGSLAANPKNRLARLAAARGLLACAAKS